VIYSADIAVPAGTTTIALAPYLNGIAISGELVADVQCYQGATVYVPASPLATKIRYGAIYRINGTNLELVNNYSACRARIVVFAQDASAPTAGSNKVLKQFNDGTRDVVQFLRPGAADPPTMADVIQDSRWPTLQLLKEGFININVNGAQQWPIAFNSTGLFPFVKYMTIHGAGSETIAPSKGTFTKRIRMPFTRLLYDRTNVYTSGDTTYCSITSTEVRFFTFKGAPIRYYYEQSAVSPGYTLQSDNDPNPITGIRYFIFGIPA
jgi:hypothetical protein